MFNKSECERLISYQKPSYKFSLSTSVEHVASIDIKELSKQIQEITPISNYAKILDNYQYIICKEIERHLNDHEYVKLLGGLKIEMCGYLTVYEMIVEQRKLDINNKQLLQQLIVISKKMLEAICKFQSSLSLIKIGNG